MTRKQVCCLFSLAMLMLTSCSSSKLELASLTETELQNIDASLVTGEPCPAPCWQGIELGDPMEEVIIQLDLIPFLQGATITQNSRDIYFDGGRIVFNGRSEVSEIYYVLMYRLTIKEMIEIYGTPNHVGVEADPRNFHFMYLEWPDQGIRVDIYRPGANRAQSIPLIDGNWLIETALYSKELTFDATRGEVLWDNSLIGE